MPRDRDQRPTRRAPGHSGSSPALDYGVDLVAGRPRSPQVPPLLCGSRALGQCPSILLGMLPGLKHLSILKEGDGNGKANPAMAICWPKPLPALVPGPWAVPPTRRHSSKGPHSAMPRSLLCRRQHGWGERHTRVYFNCGKIHIIKVNCFNHF